MWLTEADSPARVVRAQVRPWRPGDFRRLLFPGMRRLGVGGAFSDGPTDGPSYLGFQGPLFLERHPSNKQVVFCVWQLSLRITLASAFLP